MNKVTGNLVLLFIYAFAVQPFILLRRWRDIIFILLFYVLGYRKDVVWENLKNSFPDKSDNELKKIRRRYYFHLSNLIIETLVFFRINSKNLLKRVNFNNTEFLKKLYEKKKNVVLVMGHYGMWEWMLVMPQIMKHHGVVIYKPLNDKFFDAFFKKKRVKFGGTALSMKETLRGLISLSRGEKPWLAAFVADQTPTANEINYWVKFLNQDTPVFLGPEKIAKRFNAAVVYAEMMPKGRNKYDVNFTLLAEDSINTEDGEITVKFNQELEKSIKKAPEYWLWSHRRWKHKHLKDRKR
jgi:KDO2-lipid IV(A) lauroyltransferase